MRASLALRAALLVALLLGSFTVIAVVVVDRAEAAVVDVERPRLQAATAQLAAAVSYGVLAHSPALLEAPLTAFRQNSDLTSITVLDDRGAVLVEHRGTPAAGNVVVVEADVVTAGAAPGDDGDLEAFGIAPAKAERVGSVRVEYALSGVDDVQQRLRRAIFFSVAGIGLFAVILATVIASSLVSRVKKVADAARKVSGGDLGATVVDDGDDELAQLARDFNAMTASLVVQQQRLQEQGQALAEREALAALGRATAVIAHELRNPLGIVLAAAELVKNESKPMNVRADAAGLIDDEVRRLERTLADLLAYARPRTADVRGVDVKAVVDAVVARVGKAGGPAEAVAVDVKGDAVRAVVDEGFVEQIVWNLIQNAAQAGAKAVNVVVGVNGGVVEVRVSDDGSGVPASVKEQLFQPFSTTKQRGTGLGLSASRRMAQDMGGDLRFVDVAAGACFVLTLRGSP